MNNWDKYRRMQCNIQKSTYNKDTITLMGQHYQELYDTLVSTPEDEDVFNDTYLKITYKYNPDKDFIEQFKWLFQQLKGAYYRDDRANRFYQLNEECLAIPDYIPEKVDNDVSIVNRLKNAVLKQSKETEDKKG